MRHCGGSKSDGEHRGMKAVISPRLPLTQAETVNSVKVGLFKEKALRSGVAMKASMTIPMPFPIKLPAIFSAQAKFTSQILRHITLTLSVIMATHHECNRSPGSRHQRPGTVTPELEIARRDRVFALVTKLAEAFRTDEGKPLSTTQWL